MPKVTRFKFRPFSKKQKKILTWWLHPKYKDYDAIICDGSIRSGKTLPMSLSFVIWAMQSFSYKNFGMAGKTVGTLKRNVWIQLKFLLAIRGYKVGKMTDSSENSYYIRKGSIINYFYLFGGRDEASQDSVQGFTAAGFLFDEVAIMPKSFVQQAIGRCSEEGAKLWFNCNPDSPYHWFKLEWIDMAEAKNALHLHFLLDDNPSLSDKVKERYMKLYVGIFYQRFILGLWVLAEGIIYSMFRESMILKKMPANVKINKKWISIDYGQSNATVFLLLGIGSDNRLYVLDEYYHEGKTSQMQKSPAGYSKDYFKFLKKNGTKEIIDDKIRLYPVNKDTTFIDPSAKGLIMQLYEDGEKNISPAINKVNEGIELLSSIIDNDMFRILAHCKNTISEFNAYSWDPKAQERGEDKPMKTHDHCMDAIRYFVNGTRKLWQRLIITQPKVA